jgi:DNA-binding NtrC family response regulator
MQAFAGDKQRVADTAGISLRSLYRKLGESSGDKEGAAH